MPEDRELGAVVERLAQRFAAVLAVETLPPSAALTRRYGARDGRLILIRPDGYVSFKAKADEASALEAHLGRMLPNSNRFGG
jgi:hypothetical protein